MTVHVTPGTPDRRDPATGRLLPGAPGGVSGVPDPELSARNLHVSVPAPRDVARDHPRYRSDRHARRIARQERLAQRDQEATP